MRINTRSFGPSMPPATKHLIIVNVIVWLFSFVSFLMWKSGYSVLHTGGASQDGAAY